MTDVLSVACRHCNRGWTIELNGTQLADQMDCPTCGALVTVTGRYTSTELRRG